MRMFWLGSLLTALVLNCVPALAAADETYFLQGQDPAKGGFDPTKCRHQRDGRTVCPESARTNKGQGAVTAPRPN